MIGILAGLAAKALFNARSDATAAGSWWRGLNPAVRKWAVRLIILVAGFFLHQHFAHKAIAAAEKRGADAAYANVEKKAVALAARANELNRKAAELMRKRNDEKLAAVGRDADDLRVRGPGAARCTIVSGLPATPGGRVTANRPGDAAVGPVPDGRGPDLIALPFAGTVNFAEQHDTFRVEALGWREWYARFKTEWAKWNAEAAKARGPQ